MIHHLTVELKKNILYFEEKYAIKRRTLLCWLDRVPTKSISYPPFAYFPQKTASTLSFPKRFPLKLNRLEICFAVLGTISETHPEYKPAMTLKDILATIKLQSKKNIAKEQADRFISTIYFETRKAIEYRYSKMNRD